MRKQSEALRNCGPLFKGRFWPWSIDLKKEQPSLVCSSTIPTFLCILYNYVTREYWLFAAFIKMGTG